MATRVGGTPISPSNNAGYLLEALQQEGVDPALIHDFTELRKAATAAHTSFTTNPLTGQKGIPFQPTTPTGGVPLHTLDPRVSQDPRGAQALAQTQAAEQAKRGQLENAVGSALATNQVPLQARPGSVLEYALATGDFSQMSNDQLGQLLIELMMHGRNPNQAARDPNAALSPPGSWRKQGGNRFGGGTNQTGNNATNERPMGPTPQGGDLASTAERVAREQICKQGGKIGRCYHGVKESIQQATGVQLTGGSASQAADQLAASGKFKEVSVSQSQLQSLPPGAVVVWGSTSRSPDGHISVALGDGREASDHVQKQITSLRGASNFRVFQQV